MAAWTNDKIDILVCALFFFPWLEWSINLNQEKSSNVMFSTTNMRYSHIVIYVNFGIITLLYFHCKVCYIVYDCTPYSNSMYSLNIYIIYVIQILVKYGICNIPLHHYFIISLFFIYCGIIVIREWDQCLLIMWVILPQVNSLSYQYVWMFSVSICVLWKIWLTMKYLPHEPLNLFLRKH